MFIKLSEREMFCKFPKSIIDSKISHHAKLLYNVIDITYNPSISVSVLDYNIYSDITNITKRMYKEKIKESLKELIELNLIEVYKDFRKKVLSSDLKNIDIERNLYVKKLKLKEDEYFVKVDRNDFMEKVLSIESYNEMTKTFSVLLAILSTISYNNSEIQLNYSTVTKKKICDLSNMSHNTVTKYIKASIIKRLIYVRVVKMYVNDSETYITRLVYCKWSDRVAINSFTDDEMRDFVFLYMKRS